MEDARASTASPQLALRGTNSLSAKITSTLSSSHADADFRDALVLLDSRPLPGNAKARRNLRMDMQRKVIVSNAGIIADFGHVAEVSFCPNIIFIALTMVLAPREYTGYLGASQWHLQRHPPAARWSSLCHVACPQ